VEELQLIKSKNPDLEEDEFDQDRSKGDHQALDAGMITLHDEKTTLNQAKIDLQRQRDNDTVQVLLQKNEAFLLRCYLDIMEGLYRLSKLISTAAEQSGSVTSELDMLSVEIIQKISEFRNMKNKRDNNKDKETTNSHATLDTHDDKTRAQSGRTNFSEKEELNGLNIHEVYRSFLEIFDENIEDEEEYKTLKEKRTVQADEFIHKLKQVRTRKYFFKRYRI